MPAPPGLFPFRSFGGYWKDLQRITDQIVDSNYDTAVEFHPYVSTDGEYEDTAGPDSTRPVVRTRGIFVTPGAAITGEAGTQGSGMTSRVVINDAWLSITDNKFDPAAVCRKGDRIYLPRYRTWWEIGYQPPPTALYRPNIALIRLTTTDIPINPT